MVARGVRTARTGLPKGPKHAILWRTAARSISVLAGTVAAAALTYGLVRFFPDHREAYWAFAQALFLGLAAIVALFQYRSASSRRRVVFTIEYLRRFDNDYFKCYCLCTLPTLDPVDARVRITREYVEEYERTRNIALLNHDKTWPVYPQNSIQIAFLRWHNFCVHVKKWIEADILDRETMMSHMQVVFVRTEYVLRDVLAFYENKTKNPPASLRVLCTEWAREGLSEQLGDKYPLDDAIQVAGQEEIA